MKIWHLAKWTDNKWVSNCCQKIRRCTIQIFHLPYQWSDLTLTLVSFACTVNAILAHSLTSSVTLNCYSLCLFSNSNLHVYMSMLPWQNCTRYDEHLQTYGTWTMIDIQAYMHGCHQKFLRVGAKRSVPEMSSIFLTSRRLDQNFRVFHL